MLGAGWTDDATRALVSIAHEIDSARASSSWCKFASAFCTGTLGVRKLSREEQENARGERRLVQAGLTMLALQERFVPMRSSDTARMRRHRGISIG